MNSSEIISRMIIGCVLYICFVLFFKPFKMLAKCCFRGFLGVCSIFIMDFLLSPWGIAVGINGFTAGISALLGIPGVITLYGLMWFLS